MSDYTICESNQKATSLTFTCNLDNNTKEAFVSLIWNVEAFDTTKVLFADYFTHIVDVVVDNSCIVLSVVLFLALSMLGLFNPFIAVIFGIVALVISVQLNLIYLSLSSIIGLIIVAILIKVKEENT